ncbi:hypothetical protein V2I01_26915 [Micromonospora sp. BRA006-A]|nr:hypothetical protein [Micromonospora sp. BRA006-A]
MRLTSIQTQQYDLTARKHLPVDTYTLAQTMPATATAPRPRCGSTPSPAPGDLTSGGSTTPITLPSVSFTGRNSPTGSTPPAASRRSTGSASKRSPRRPAPRSPLVTSCRSRAPRRSPSRRSRTRAPAIRSTGRRTV